MIIKEMKPLSLAEASEYIENTEVKGFIKKFSKMTPGDAKKMREEIEALDSIKIKSEHIVKVIDILPEDDQDVAKIFNEVNLDENEVSKIVEIVKKYK